jgi:hypothetical protein
LQRMVMIVLLSFVVAAGGGMLRAWDTAVNGA